MTRISKADIERLQGVLAHNEKTKEDDEVESSENLLGDLTSESIQKLLQIRAEKKIKSGIDEGDICSKCHSGHCSGRWAGEKCIYPDKAKKVIADREKAKTKGNIPGWAADREAKKKNESEVLESELKIGDHVKVTDQWKKKNQPKMSVDACHGKLHGIVANKYGQFKNKHGGGFTVPLEHLKKYNESEGLLDEAIEEMNIGNDHFLNARAYPETSVKLVGPTNHIVTVVSHPTSGDLFCAPGEFKAPVESFKHREKTPQFAWSQIIPGDKMWKALNGVANFEDWSAGQSGRFKITKTGAASKMSEHLNTSIIDRALAEKSFGTSSTPAKKAGIQGKCTKCGAYMTTNFGKWKSIEHSSMHGEAVCDHVVATVAELTEAKEVQHRGWVIKPHDGVQIGYKNPNSKSLKQQLGFNTHKKIKGYTLSHPEHGQDIKHVSTIAHAKKYIDDYEGKSESDLSTSVFEDALDERKFVMSYKEPFDKGDEETGGHHLKARSQSDAEKEAAGIAKAQNIKAHKVVTKKDWKQGVVNQARKDGHA